MTDEELAVTLDEIELYFAGCYMNAVAGGKAQEKFDRWMTAVGEAKKVLERETGTDS